ncbi:MAG: hypothetical protein RLZZ262_2223, partial [Bacteroidota bacterium]
LYNLTAAGIGHIDIYDHDTVDLSNLNRQILYQTQDIGKSKALTSAHKLSLLNPEIAIDGYPVMIDRSNIESLLSPYEIIVEGGDSPAGRNLINEFCLERNINFVHASAQFSYGYVFSVLPKRRTACFCCFFPTDYTREVSTGPVPVNTLSTSVAGALGAAEVMKYFLGYEENMLFNQRLCFSSLLLSSDFITENQPRRADCPVCSKIYN